MKRYQITEYADWFSQKEVIEIIKKLGTKDSPITIIRLHDANHVKDEVER